MKFFTDTIRTSSFIKHTNCCNFNWIIVTFHCESFYVQLLGRSSGRRFCPRLRIDLRTKCIIVEKMSLFEGQFRDKGVTAHRPQLITRSSSPGSLRSSKLFCSSWPAVYPSMLITSLYNKKKMPIFMDIFFFMLVLKLVVKRESLECNNFNIFVY